MSTAPKRFLEGEVLIELISFEFEWVSAKDKSKNTVANTLSVVPMGEDDCYPRGSCGMTISMTGRRSGNFTTSALYYYSALRPIKQPRSRKVWESNLEKGVIWTKFAELARMAAVNAGSNPYDIPLFPNKVRYEAQVSTGTI
jgi:hypothetical protein